MIGLLAMLACAPKVAPEAAAAQPPEAPEVTVILEFENANAVDLAVHVATAQGVPLFVDPALLTDAPTVSASHIGPPDDVVPGLAADLVEHQLVLERTESSLLLYRPDSATLVRHPPPDPPTCPDSVSDLAPYEQTYRLIPAPEGGVRIHAVRRGSAMHGLGLKNGDVLLRVGDWTGDQPPEGAFVALEAAATPDVTTEFEVVRRNQPVTYSCTVVSQQTP